NLEFKFRSDLESSASSNGQCWLNLFKSPVIVEGYPILTRPEYGTGVEIPLNVVAKLAQARRVTAFGGQIFVKGFCAMLVLARRLGDVSVWHLMVNKDESHISYLDPRLSDLLCDHTDDVELSSLESARHIVGWCRDAKSHAGELGANYNVGRSQLWNGVRLHRGESISDPPTAMGKRDNGPPHGKYGRYFDRMQLSRGQWVVLYDTKDSRGWLVDGASALLHLTRASLASDQ
ncbi:hypothetical protein DL98DRAFT_393071, partial [Cadophora sp. DSE1049]